MENHQLQLCFLENETDIACVIHLGVQIANLGHLHIINGKDIQHEVVTKPSDRIA